MRRVVFALVLVLAAATTLVSSFPAAAQFRTLPAAAKRATMGAIDGNATTLDGKKVLLSPGAQIRDGRNLIVVPNMVPPNLLVKYLLDGEGKIFRVWILSPAEAAQPDPK